MFEASTFLTTEKSEVSSANNLGFDVKCSDKSIILMKNNSDPRIEPWETLASILAHKEYCPFNMTLWILISKKSVKVFKSSPGIPLCLLS